MSLCETMIYLQRYLIEQWPKQCIFSYESKYSLQGYSWWAFVSEEKIKQNIEVVITLNYPPADYTIILKLHLSWFGMPDKPNTTSIIISTRPFHEDRRLLANVFHVSSLLLCQCSECSTVRYFEQRLSVLWIFPGTKDSITRMFVANYLARLSLN